MAIDASNIALAENAKNKALEIDSELLSTGTNCLCRFCNIKISVELRCSESSNNRL